MANQRKLKRSEILQLYCMGNFTKYLQETTLHGLKYLADSSLTIWEKLFFLSSFIAAFITVVNLITNIYVKWDSTPVIIGISPHPISILKNAQPCSRFLLFCSISSITYNCSDLFREVITDEGLCCVFNTLHSDFLYKGKYDLINSYNFNKATEAVNWNPENGYPTNLPEQYYPRPAAGAGVSMGVTVIVNAELDEYYCSTTNGPGLKVSLHNPIETPNVKDAGLTVPLGFETRFRIDAISSEALPSIRNIHRLRRQCLFMNEEPLLYFKYYTRRNCESECQTAFLYQQCSCIPYTNPIIYANASMCTVKEGYCINQANIQWSQMAATNLCLNRCLPSCFDLAFFPDSFSSPLADRNFIIQSSILQNMTKAELRKNIASIHFYYRETVFYGNLKNVYFGITEFLSNIGGIMGLFMGFSFISVAEIVYFSILRPVFKFILPRKCRKTKANKNTSNRADHKINPNWISEEIYKNQTLVLETR